MLHKASAQWQGGLKDGKGVLSTESGALAQNPYSFRTRFEEHGSKAGTNPEELIAAAHAGCFSMALSAELGNDGMTAERISTTATVELHFIDGKPTVTKSHLHLRAKIPGADREKFLAAAHRAETGCPISRLLKAEITLDADLES
ncbi:MAG: OsmC family protein [Verrucomicrobia bacterium]|nr:OsmC family protein [Verrucomicrobiota bacterium]MBV9658961.1 OsmC family protein [Verrucomicrobiota bacterium]